MSNHLSDDQFAKCVIGRPAKEELQHIRECPKCSGELDRFAVAISLFRGSVRDRTDARAVLAVRDVPQFTLRPAAEGGVPIWRWALVVVAVVVLIMVPFLIREKRPQQVIEKTSIQTDPDALMRAVNLQVSRTLPAPMEPMMSLLPNDELTTQSGGTQ